jgi:hypothetical protein
MSDSGEVTVAPDAAPADAPEEEAVAVEEVTEEK